MLTDARLAERGALVFNDGIWNSLTGTQFTSFTGTKVQILTPEERRALLFNDGIWNCRIGVSIGTFVRCQYLYFCTSKASKLSGARSSWTTVWNFFFYSGVLGQGS
jgi:hypothetical protein